MTLAARVAARLPERLLVRIVSLAYRRFEPEIRRLDEVCGRGGTMVDIGGWYGPWTRRLVHRADQIVIVEPTPLHQVLRRTLPPAVDVVAAAASDHLGLAEIWLPSCDEGARTCHVSERGLLARALWPFPRYLNSVLFLPGSQVPGSVRRLGVDRRRRTP